MKSKLDHKRFSDISAQLNWQIQQEERRILNRCSFFAFVGSAEAFRRPRKITQSIKTPAVGTVLIPRSVKANLERRPIPT